MHTLRSEEEIISNWKGAVDNPLVSICCITYNHEAYIEAAIEGFLIQETNFPFEVIVHDDASTDETAKVVRDFAAKYPRIIKPIFQTDNQYSISHLAPVLLPLEKCRGEYIAFCEGDDYWLEPGKLSYQIEVLKKNPDISMSSHAVEFIFDGVEESRQNYTVPQEVTGDFPQVLNRGLFMAFNSLVCRRELLMFPEWLNKLAGIHKYLIYSMSMQGRIDYSTKKMAVKRRNPGGVTIMNQKERKATYFNNNIFLLENMKSISNGRWDRLIDKKIAFLFLRKAFVDCTNRKYAKLFSNTKKSGMKLIEAYIGRGFDNEQK